MLQSLILLMSLQLLGELLSQLLAIPIPGAIIGMALLLSYLMVRGFVTEPLAKTADALFPYLPLLLIPPSVGVIQYGELLKTEGMAIMLALTLSVILSLAITPFIFIYCKKFLSKTTDNES